ncbi:hypothetical protein DFO73_13111 [Cytobacillus oceanisediminis]|uniref:Uncharacterized protein n=1 Tax=Cytobacillus oceanisediminis TaxID=665099 RepID=A0A2V2ZBY0_9BACI|nr:hypothetical protein DFO73_13111 [Cytobacillus oceanisediminis]
MGIPPHRQEIIYHLYKRMSTNFIKNSSGFLSPPQNTD